MSAANANENTITVAVSFQAVFLSGHVTFFSSLKELTKYPRNGERRIVRRKNFHILLLRTGSVALARNPPTGFKIDCLNENLAFAGCFASFLPTTTP